MVTLRTHWDADGITAGYFASIGIPNSEIKVGNYEEGFGSTKGLTKDDWMLDMKPQDKSWNGTCLDHHFPHPEDRKYKLIPDIKNSYLDIVNSIVPASLISFNHFKESIPKKEHWKLMIGLMGDGQPELMPPEIFALCPSLLKSVSTSIYQSYGNWKVSTMPLYKVLSSGINALLRKGDNELAISIMKYSNSPLDIHTSEEISIAKKEIRDEYTLAVKDSEIFEYENLVVIIFDSKFRLSGYISSSLQSEFIGKTIMAVNKRNGSVSMRGDLASYINERLKPIEYLECSGHMAFMGGKLKKNYVTFIEDLNQLFK